MTWSSSSRRQLPTQLSAPASSSGRWSSRTRQSPTGEARRECEARPRLGSPPPYGGSALEPRSTVFSYRPVFSPLRSNSNTVRNPARCQRTTVSGVTTRRDSRLGSPPPYGRSALEPRSTVFSCRAVSSLSRSSSSKVEIRHDASERPLRINEHERLLPGAPEATGEYPEDFVNRSHPGSGMLALQHSQLLPESEIFQEQASMRSKAAGEQAKP